MAGTSIPTSSGACWNCSTPALPHTPTHPPDAPALIVISKSGGTLETAAAFRNFRELVERRFGSSATELIVPVTGETGRLRQLCQAAGYVDAFSIPEGIGGRFSVFTAGGLLPAAAAGFNIRALLQGAGRYD
jgi:glucose-6-phosphate isomerase